MIKILLVLLSLISFSFANSKKPEDVLKTIYPNSTIEVKNFILNFQQIENIKQIARVKFDSKLISIYIVKRIDKIIAYGYVDVHVVRTKPEVVLYTITPEGKIDIVQVLHFGEPLEYLPDEKWFDNFKGKSLDKDPVRVKVDIPNVSGATLTSRAVTDYARLALAIWKVLFGEQK